MNEEADKTIICLAKAKAFTAHPESVIRWCSVCAAEVWISKGGLAVYDNNPARTTLVCTDCAPGVVATDKDPKWAGISLSGEIKPLSRGTAEHVMTVLAEEG